MHVTEHKYLELVLRRYGSQSKVGILNDISFRFQITVELRENPLRRNLVAGRHRNEHISPFLFRGDLIKPFFIGGYDFHTIRHHNTWHSCPVTGHIAVYRSALIDFHTRFCIIYENRSLPQQFPLRTSRHIHLVFAVLKTIRQDHIDIPVCYRGYVAYHST